MAELVSIKRNVDVSPGQAAPAVFHCSQGDVGSKIILGLLNNGTAYAIPSGVTVTIEGSESNGSIFTPISATASGSDITFYLTGEMTAVAGPAICQAVLKSGSNILGTANFTLEVESSPMGADAPPVFTDAGWTWMLNKLTTEFVPALGDNIIDAIDGKADQSDLTALSNTVAGHTGSITVLNNTVNNLNQSVTENRQNIAKKLDKNQGTANAGKYLKVGADGNVTAEELDVTTDKTLSIADKAADAKAVGDEITNLKADLSESVEEISKRLDLTSGGVPNGQIVNIEEFTPIKASESWRYNNVIIPFPGDGRYYSNPILESNTPYWNVISFLDENGNSIKITNDSSGNVESYISNASYDAIEIEGLSIRRIQYSYYDYLVNDRVRNISRYTLVSTPASMKFTIYNVYEKGIAGITKDAWYTDYKPYGGKDYIYSDELIDTIEDSVGISNSKVIAPVYDATVTYAVDDYVLYGGKLYKCIIAISTAEAWNSAHWEELLLTGEFKDLNNMQTATSDDVGKALKAKTVSNGKVTEWEFGEAGDTAIIASAYRATSTYAVGDYCVYDNTLYKCNTAIETAEAWNSEHWTEVTFGEELTDVNVRLDMCVVKQLKPKPEPVENVQCINPEDITNITLATKKRISYSKVDVSRDGTYRGNPVALAYSLFINAKFYNEYDEVITLTKKSDGTTKTALDQLQCFETSWFTIEDDGYTIKQFVRNGILSAVYSASSKISYIGPNVYLQVPMDTDETKLGLTYGTEAYEEYVPYASTPDVPDEYEYAYNLDIARFVQDYMEAHGTGVSNRVYDVTYPEKDNTDFANAVKYYHERADRKRNNVIRFASFNKFVSRGSSNWSTIKQELADYSVDICGFQECAAVVSDGAVTDQIGAYLQGWQYKGYAAQDATIDKAIVSHWTVTQTDIITLLTYDNAGTSNCIHALMTIPADKYYSHAISADATLSVYCYHGSSGDKVIGGVKVADYRVREMEISALLNAIAQDSADFIVIVGDTNAFEHGFDIHTGTHAEWEQFRDAGFTPVLDGHNSTVTANLQDRYFCKADNNEIFCIASYDQIFIGANITAKRFGVVDSNLYQVESLKNVPVSDHCMVYADLEFDFDAVQQAKLAEIAITEPWW